MISLEEPGSQKMPSLPTFHPRPALVMEIKKMEPYGQGNSEKARLTAPLELGRGVFSVTFNLPRGNRVRSARWDPVSDRFCRCRVTAVETNGMRVEIQGSNAWRKTGEQDEFATSDPMYFLGGDFADAGFLRIKGSLEMLTEAEIGHLADDLRRRDEATRRRLESRAKTPWAKPLKPANRRRLSRPSRSSVRRMPRYAIR